MRSMRHSPRSVFRHVWAAQGGITLMEMVVAMIVLSLVTLVWSPFLRSQINAYFTTQDAKYATQFMRIGMNRMLMDIANARGTSSSDISTFTSTAFDFYTSSGQRIEYSWGDISYQGTTKKCIRFRGGASSNPRTPLIPDVTSCTFAYFDQNGNPTSTRSEIRLIRISFTCTYNGKSYTLSGQIAPPAFQQAGG